MKRVLPLFALIAVPFAAAVLAQVSVNGVPPALAAPVQLISGSANSVLAVDGTAAAPSIAFASQPGVGWYHASTNTVDYGVSGTQYAQFNGNNLSLLRDLSALNFGAAADTSVTRPSAGVVKVAHATATSTAELQVSGGSGGSLSAVKALTELTTIAAAATTTTAIQIPTNAVVLGVSVRVVTVIPTAATFTVTSATPAKTWNTVAVAVAAGTTDPGTAPGPSFQTTASAITITPNLSPATATGQVRVTIYYYQVTPPTS